MPSLTIHATDDSLRSRARIGAARRGTVGGVTVDDRCFLSAAEQAALVASGEVSPLELVEMAMWRIGDVQPQLNCFAHVWADEARQEAIAAAEVPAEHRGPLHGVPVAVKETTQVAGRRFTAGSRTQIDTVADRDAYVTEALRRSGAIVIGATTSPEFAHTLQTDSPLWGTTRNPWNPAFTPGGSSGGSGAAVASGCVALAEGSDMGGSVRIPASWCGIVGLKPGIGRIPMDVLPGLFDSISHHGPLARSVDDARLFLRCTQGPDDRDLLSVTTPLDLSGPTPSDVRGMRFGLSVDLGSWYVHPEIEAAVVAAAHALEAAGAIVEPVDPGLGEADEFLWIQLWGVFMSGYFGDLVDEHVDVMDPDVVRLIELGNSLSATHVKRLELQRTETWRKVSGVLAGRDALLCPTMAMPPAPAAKADRVRPHHPDDGRYHAEDMTAVFNLVAPCPAITVPCGMHAEAPFAGMPIGLQVVGHRWREDTVLRVARAVEVAMPEFTGRRPPV
jgi:Asp-tRNA(Asn)/Glu-tRNA(Gln) amidotransferase A subunit family amidase